MNQTRVDLQHVPERFAAATVAGVLAWWLTQSVVPLPWAVLPCAALALAVISHRIWPVWLTWAAAISELAILLILTFHSLRFETIFASIALTIVFAGLTAATCALVTSRSFPQQTVSVIVWLAVAAALTGQGSPWIAPVGLAALASIALLANRREIPHDRGFRPLLPVLTGILLLVIIAGVSPVGPSPLQKSLTTLIQHVLVPQTSAPQQSQQTTQTGQTTEETPSSGTRVRYVAPMLKIWIFAIQRVFWQWAPPLILGLLTICLGLAGLLMLTHSSISHILRVLTPVLLLFGGAVVVFILASSWQLPRGGALLKLVEQLSKITSLSASRQPSATTQILTETIRAVPSWLQVAGAVFFSMVLVGMVVTVALILSRAAFATRFGFLSNITDVNERKRVAAAIRRIASLDDSLLTSNPREAVIALFYMGVAALQDLGLSLLRGETPEELAARTRQRSESVASFLDFLVTAFYHARYSDQDVQPQHAIACRDTYKRLVAAVKMETTNERALRSRTTTVE